jgi:hypothetical protein
MAWDNAVTIGKDQYHLLSEVRRWCLENIGHGGYINDPTLANPDDDEEKWLVDTTYGNSTFVFKYESDAILFTLRWA